MKKIKLIAVLVCFFSVLTINFALFSPTTFSKPVFASSSINTTAKGMVVLEKDSKRVLYEANSDKKLPMASTTKIITAIYVIEHNDNLNKVIEIPKEATKIEGTSIGLMAGEHLTIRELLYGLMLRSGNDSAVALSIATSGSEKQFVDDVNAWLKNNGYTNTHLMNPHGLHHDEHYTCAYDLARITAYALSNPVFSEIVSTQKKTISNELKSKTSRDLVNKNKLLKNYEYANGVKTGFTRRAGRCFVGSATKDGMTLVCVLLNCNPMFEECQSLLDSGFEEYKLYKLISKGDKLGEVSILKSEQKSLETFAGSDLYYPLKRSELKDIKMKIDLPKKLTAPIQKGESVGDIKINLANQLIFSDKIYSIKSVESNTFGAEFQKILDNM